MNRIIIAMLLSCAPAVFGQSKQVKALEAAAQSAADHRQLAEHYHAEAARERAEAKKHAVEADGFARNPDGGAAKRRLSYRTEEHCRFVAGRHARAAEKAELRAARQERLAASASAK